MRELLQQALDALEKVYDAAPIDATRYDLCNAIRDHLAAPMPEPVAWGMFRADGLILDVITPEEHESYAGEYTVPLYAAPPAAPQPEPIGNVDQVLDEVVIESLHLDRKTLVYLAPPAAPAPVVREPLTDEQLETVARDSGIAWSGNMFRDVMFAACRAVERAHGIGGGGK